MQSYHMKLFSEHDIYKIYDSHIHLPASYFTKYEALPTCPVKSWSCSWKGKDFPRVWCILDFIEWTNKHNIKNGCALGFTNNDPEIEFVTYEEQALISYPKYDLHTLSSYFQNYFDFFIFNQTLEHLYNPFLAVQNIYDAVRSGGYVFTSVPTLNIPHLTPIHFNGFTPAGLAMLFASANFEIVEIGQWGNYRYIQQLWYNHAWPTYEDIQIDGRVTNEECNVCQCWILAKKS